MRLFRCLLLPVLALTAVSGTCVTGVRQLTDAGPWTGLITNTGDTTIADVSLTADVRDAGGASLRYSARTCPTELLPGQRGQDLHLRFAEGHDFTTSAQLRKNQ